MNKHLAALNNPTVKELVIARLKDAKDDFNELKGAGATAADELLFNLPSKNRKINELIEEYKGRHPHKHAVAKGLGFVGSGIAPGMAGVKVLSKIGKIGKVLKGGGIGQTLSQGAVYGGAPKAVETIVKGEDDGLLKTLLASTEGAMAGAALGGAGRAIKSVRNALKPVMKREESRQFIDRAAKKLISQMNPRDIKRMRDIKLNPIESKHVNYNTLLHRGTENTKAVADALYQLSPKARELVKARKKQLIDGQLPYIEESIIKAGGTSFRPKVKDFVDIMTKREKAVAAPLYEKAYERGVIEIPERLKGDKTFKNMLKKSLNALNDLDKGKAGYEPHSVRMLQTTKEHMDDEVKRLFSAGKNREGRDAQIAKDSLREHLNAAAPEYEKATKTSQKYFKIADAAKDGLSFDNKYLEETKNLLKNMSDHEKYAYKTGTLENLINKAADKGQKSELGDFGKDITTPENQRLLEEILGKDKFDKLVKDVEINKNALENFKEFTKGSGTSKHESNKALVMNAIGAANGSPKSTINLLYKLKNKLGMGNSDLTAKTQMKLLLDPKRLLKYETKKVKNKKSLHPAIAGTIVRAREESMK